MDYATVAVTVGLMLLGGGLVAWPLGLIIRSKNREVNELEHTVQAFEAILGTERTIDDARDLPPADQLGVLLDGPSPDNGTTHGSRS